MLACRGQRRLAVRLEFALMACSELEIAQSTVITRRHACSARRYRRDNQLTLE